tara:strand:+ start:353 stop:1300 length:948 start_codon:yes stop_codon:yes gene_type:complete
MRQAGRYLPEFKKIRSQNKDFIKLCLNSELSSQITIQPIRRFNLDSAIIFSDILMIPYALGQEVAFTKDFGPLLSSFNQSTFFNNNENEFSKKLSPIYKAIEITRKQLSKDKSLIGFVGAPWTLLIYMLKLKRNKTDLDLKKLDDISPKINSIIEQLIKYICIHIKNQINAGADVVQIFDSWAGIIPQKNIREYCYLPNLKIVEFCKREKISNICFPKGLGKKYKEFNDLVKPDGINLDPEINPSWAISNLKDVVIQGGLDPKVLLEPEEEMLQKATRYIQTFKDIPYIFNLGHGLLPETDPDKVEKLIKYYRNF